MVQRCRLPGFRRVLPGLRLEKGFFIKELG
jgi:hypothetical protein